MKYHLLQNVVLYYEQFSPLVDKQLSKALQPIEKELKEFIAIQRWKGITGLIIISFDRFYLI